MKLRAAVVFLALAAPALAQHGGAHAGTHSGSPAAGRGVAGHAGFSASPGFARPGFSRPSGFAPPVRGFRSAPLGNAGYSPRFSPPSSAFPRSPYASGRSTGYRPEYRPGTAGASRSGDRGRDRDRDRFGERRREFDNWRANIYPLWLGYPYTIDPGFFDWGDTDDSAYGSSGDNSQYDQSPPQSYPGPYTDEDDRAAGREQYTAAGSGIPSASASPAPATGQSLTVIFKDGRAPVKVENYMMTATVLTDLDPQHYENIPLDQIDLAATRSANSAAGLEFQVPGASRD